MELFLPSLFVVVIAALLAFVIIPRMGSMILAITSLIALILAGFHHYNLFYSEYQLSTWQNGIGTNAPFFILGLAILFIIGAIFYMFRGGAASVASVVTNLGNIGNVKNMLPATSPMEEIQNAVQNSVANMPPANTATNPITGAINAGLKNIVGNVAPTGNNRSANNKPANNKSMIPNLGFRASEI